MSSINEQKSDSESSLIHSIIGRHFTPLILELLKSKIEIKYYKELIRIKDNMSEINP